MFPVNENNCLFTFSDYFIPENEKNINFYGDRKKGHRCTNSKPLSLVNEVLDSIFFLIISRYLTKKVLVKGTLCTREEHLFLE